MATDKTIENTNNAIDTKTFILSSDPERAMQQMMETIDTLRDIYVEENEKLQSSDANGFLGLQDKKIEAVRHYHDGAQQLLQRKDDLAHIDQAVKDQLTEKQEEFTGIMSENLKAIDRLRNSVGRLNDRIMSTARNEAQKKNINYSKQGTINKNERSISIGVSESV